MERIHISKEKEVIVDIETGESSHGIDNIEADPISGKKRGKKSLKKLVSGALGFDGLSKGEPSSIKSDSHSHLGGGEKLLGHQDHQLIPLVAINHHEKEKRRAASGKANKPPKPPRPPSGPTLDAGDMRFIREISKIAMKKRERIERMKALKTKMKESQSPESKESKSSLCAVLAMLITLLFFVLVISQGVGSKSNGSNTRSWAGAPQPAPETNGLPPEQQLNDTTATTTTLSNLESPKFRGKGQPFGSDSSSLG